MKDYFNKNIIVNRDKNSDSDSGSYGFYSKVLLKPFDSLDELKKAEATYYAEQRAKEDKAAAKKADAMKVEATFKALNAARKTYKDSLLSITEKYTENLKELKKAFEADKAKIQDTLSAAETAYSTALKEFNDKHPEGYHITLKDGDFETTISSHTLSGVSFDPIVSIFDWIFS